jgi:hypothetical protein
MSNFEREALRGKMVGIEKNLREEKMRADGAGSLLRRAISIAIPIREWDAERIKNYANQLADSLNKINELTDEAERLDNELNG